MGEREGTGEGQRGKMKKYRGTEGERKGRERGGREKGREGREKEKR